MHKTKTVTVIYYKNDSLELFHYIGIFLCSDNGRVIIPNSFKKDKSIIAVCDGEVEILNKIGDRILSFEQEASNFQLSETINP